MKFPIAEVSGNRLIDLNGECSWMYEVMPPDQEQMNQIEKFNFYEGVESCLNNLHPQSWLKLYSINGKQYLNTNQNDLEIDGVRLVLQDNPLSVLFEDGLFTDIAVLEDEVHFNKRAMSILSVEFLGELSSMIRGYGYVLSFKRVDSNKAKKRLETIRSAQQSAFSKLKKDISGESSYFQAEELLDDLIHGRESLFEMEMFFLTENPRELQKELSLLGIGTYLEGQSLKKLKAGLGEIFTSIIPGVRPTFKYRSIPNKTSHIKYLLPISSSKLMDNGIEFLDIDDSSIFFNPFQSDLKNRNMLVTGQSGAGKSVLVNKFVHELASKESRHPVVILDKGGSFKRTATYHDGEVLEGAFNAFQYKDPIYLRELILSVVDKESFNKLERGRLLKEIKLCMGECKSLAELISRLEETFQGISLYFEEIMDSLNGETLKCSSFLYVDIENFPKGIVSPLIIFLLEHFKSLKGEKILVFDEVWSLIKGHGEYIDECFRTFRKSGAFPIAISQSLKDFDSVDSELQGSITNNSYFKVFFPQETDESNEIDSFDISRITDLQYSKGEYSECYLKSADNKYRKILRLELTSLEYELFHTESGEDIHFWNFFHQFRPFFKTNKDTINSYIRLKHENDSSKLHPFNILKADEGQHAFYA